LLSLEGADPSATKRRPTPLIPPPPEDVGLVAKVPGASDLDDATREAASDEPDGYEPEHARVGARAPGNPFLR
jgi:hypothetical protein